MTSYTLRIDFIGLCLFAVDRDAIHVLLPSTTHDCCPHPPGQQMPVHVPKLRIKTDSSPNGGTKIPLNNVALDLRSIGDSGTFERFIPSSVVDLHLPTGKKIHRDLLGATNPRCVNARISLASGMAFSIDPEAEWDFGAESECGRGSLVRLSHRLRWEISGLTAGSLEFAFTPLRDVGAPRPMSTEPSDGLVHLEITHAPPPGTGGKFPPDTCDQAAHFACYYGLLPGATNKPVPFFQRDLRKREVKGPGTPPPLTDNYTCMLAQAPVGP